jgi:hypothetical protein
VEPAPDAVPEPPPLEAPPLDPWLPPPVPPTPFDRLPGSGEPVAHCDAAKERATRASRSPLRIFEKPYFDRSGTASWLFVGSGSHFRLTA